MNELAISRIEIDEVNRLRVYPRALSGYEEFVYRDASSVRWDRDDHYFYCLPVDSWTIVDEFFRIRDAVARELGDWLIIDDATRTNLTPVVAAGLIARIQSKA